jgi:glycosyltransferase involved in cell wall biosynthesis
MRIAQVAPLFESVPPAKYGGTELFASGDSKTRARLIAPCPRSLRLAGNCRDPLAHHVQALDLVRQHAGEFDMIHFHSDYAHFPLSRQMGWAHVTTLHGRLDMPDLRPLYREFCDMPLVSISDAQRSPLPWADWRATVYHGLPRDAYTFRAEPGHFLAFLGRLSPEKRVDRAVEIARRAGLPLVVGAKIDPADRPYFDVHIKPLFDDPAVRFVGEVGPRLKNELLSNALALLFPIDWPEPFGLVMIEAMACGTPVIGWRCGSVPEVIDDGLTGFMVDSVDQAVEAIGRVRRLNRREVRATFERRFVVERMASDYLEVYERLLLERKQLPSARAQRAGAVDHSLQPGAWASAGPDGRPIEDLAQAASAEPLRISE